MARLLIELAVRTYQGRFFRISTYAGHRYGRRFTQRIVPWGVRLTERKRRLTRQDRSSVDWTKNVEAWWQNKMPVSDVTREIWNVNSHACKRMSCCTKVAKHSYYRSSCSCSSDSKEWAPMGKVYIFLLYYKSYQGEWRSAIILDLPENNRAT